MSQPNSIYKNLPSEQYLADDRINNSAPKLINKPPLHYKKSQAQQNGGKTTVSWPTDIYIGRVISKRILSQ